MSIVVGGNWLKAKSVPGWTAGCAYGDAHAPGVSSGHQLKAPQYTCCFEA